MMKTFIRADLPIELLQQWLQHVRDFDTAHPGHHFEVLYDAPDEPLAAMLERIKIDPALTFTTIFERKKHEYPSDYPPGTHWAIDAAWEILDWLKPDRLTIDERSLLAGQIAGRLMKERSNENDLSR